MTQRDLAEKLGVGQSYVCNFERGDRGLSTDLLGRLARILRVSADELLGLKKQTSNGQPLPRRFLRRLRDIDRLSDKEQGALLQTLDAFLERAELKGATRQATRVGGRAARGSHRARSDEDTA
jgi:transcriptional regulator with XRE-family HTH domain